MENGNGNPPFHIKKKKGIWGNPSHSIFLSSDWRLKFLGQECPNSKSQNKVGQKGTVTKHLPWLLWWPTFKDDRWQLFHVIIQTSQHLECPTSDPMNLYMAYGLWGMPYNCLSSPYPCLPPQWIVIFLFASLKSYFYIYIYSSYIHMGGKKFLWLTITYFFQCHVCWIRYH